MRRLYTLLVAVVIAWGALALTLRAMTPLLADYRAELAAFASERLGVPVSAGAVKARWYGIRPLLELHEVRLGEAPRELQVEHVELDLAPAGLLRGTLADSLRVTVRGLSLTAVRDASGRLSVFSGSPDAGGTQLELGHLPSHLRLVDTRVLWIDERLDMPALSIEDIDIQLDRAGKTLELRARMRSAAGEANLSMATDGPLAAGTWNGDSYIEISGLDIARLLSDGVPGLAGLDPFRIDGKAWTQWRNGRAAHSQGSIELTAADKLDVGDGIRAISTEFSTAITDDRVRVGLHDLEVATTTRQWPAGDLAVAIEHEAGTPRHIDVATDHLQLDDLARLSQPLAALDSEIADLITALQPAGQVRGLRLQAQAADGHWSWRARGQFAGLGVAPYATAPGIDNLAGRFHASDSVSQVSLDSQDSTVSFTDLFRNPIELRRLAGLIEVSRDNEGWRVRSDKLEAITPHITTVTRLQLRQQPDRALFIDLQTDFRDGDAAHAGRYYPAGIMGKKVVAWLDRAIASGRVIAGSALVHGYADEFAFEKTRSGRFEVVFDTADLALDYREGWPPLTGLAARVSFHGNQLEIRSRSGAIYDSRIEDVYAHIASLNPASTIRIRGNVLGPLQNTLQVLGEPALRPRFGDFADILRGDGDSLLSLDFTLPLAAGAEISLNGQLQFAGNSLHLRDHALTLSDISGALDFDLGGLRAKDIRATALGTRINVNVAPGGDGYTRVRTRGAFTARAAADQLPTLPLTLADGRAAFTIDVEIPSYSARRQPTMLNVSSDLRGMSIALPSPLGKAADSTRDLAVSVPLGGRDEPVRVRLGESLDIIASRDARRVGVRLGGGEAVLPQAAAIQLRGSLGELDVAAWQEALAELPAADADGPDIDADLAIARLRYGDAQVDDLRIQARGNPASWQADVDAPEIAGRITMQTDDHRDRIDIALAHLHVPRAETDGIGPRPGPSGGPDPVTVPAIDVVIDDLRLGDARLGRLVVRTEPINDGLAITTAELVGESLTVTAEGDWRQDNGSTRSRLAGTASSADIGDLLLDLGYVRQLDDADAKANFDLMWPGNPTQFHRATVAGELEVGIGEGRLVEIDPGVTRVIGLINLNTLARRLRLDFGDLFKKGYSFDSIDGTFDFDAGVATTADLRMIGPSGRLRIQGATDLVDETVDQQVVVIPKLDATLPIAGTIAGGPVAGLAVLVAQEAISTQVDQIYRFDYAIHGPWANPTIELLDSGGTLSKLLRPLTRLGGKDGAAADVAAEPPAPEATPPEPAPGAAIPSSTMVDPDSPAASALSAARDRVDRAVRRLLRVFGDDESPAKDLPGESE